MRDMELVRDLLLKISKAETPPSLSELIPGRKEETPEYMLADYHVRMLVHDAQFLRGTDANSSSGPEWLTLELTWAGNDFLSNIRDPTVWERTKRGVQMLGGASWDIVIQLAKSYVKQEAKKRLGIDLG